MNLAQLLNQQNAFAPWAGNQFVAFTHHRQAPCQSQCCTNQRNALPSPNDQTGAGSYGSSAFFPGIIFDGRGDLSQSGLFRGSFDRTKNYDWAEAVGVTEGFADSFLVTCDGEVPSDDGSNVIGVDYCGGRPNSQINLAQLAQIKLELFETDIGAEGTSMWT